MPLDAPYRLPQSVRSAVQVIMNSSRSVSMMRVEDYHRSLLRIFRITQIPVMAGIPGHDRYIIGIRGYDGEIF